MRKDMLTFALCVTWHLCGMPYLLQGCRNSTSGFELMLLLISNNGEGKQLILCAFLFVLFNNCYSPSTFVLGHLFYDFAPLQFKSIYKVQRWDELNNCEVHQWMLKSSLQSFLWAHMFFQILPCIEVYLRFFNWFWFPFSWCFSESSHARNMESSSNSSSFSLFSKFNVSLLRWTSQCLSKSYGHLTFLYVNVLFPLLIKVPLREKRKYLYTLDGMEDMKMPVMMGQ